MSDRVDAGDTLSTADAEETLSIRQLMQSLSIRQRMQETLYQPVDAGVSLRQRMHLSDSGGRSPSIRLMQETLYADTLSADAD